MYHILEKNQDKHHKEAVDNIVDLHVLCLIDILLVINEKSINI